MPFLVDGDNLLGTWRGRRRSDAERRKLAMQLARWAALQKRRIVVVFDGSAPPAAAFGSGVLFSGRGRSADEVILAFLREQQDRRGWIVATSDRSLGDQCRHLGARIERSDRFRGRLRAQTPEEKPEREEDLAYWLEQFGEADDDLAE